MSDGEDFEYFEEDFDERKHDKLVENILSLNKTQNLKRPSRTEPTLQISEFNLVKSVTGKKGSVQIDELTKILKNKKKHIKIGKRLESTNRKGHTLPKPLEKPQSDRIKRSVGYEKNRFLFDRWEAFVLSNRAQAHQIFPLDSVEKINIEARNAVKLPDTWKVKSELQKELEKLDEQVEEYHIEDENDKNDFSLTLEELQEFRKNAAKLRAHQSYKEAKARRQNKIKSKKYHRILRKERIKQKLKEFEELQKTNPEEALKKLEDIEKARALERFSLRHKSTGQWAKSKQFRAKYDKESRQVLAEQLQISRDLTQKLQHTKDDSEDEDLDFGLENEEILNVQNNDQNEDNPWVNGPKPDKEVSEFVNGYRKFWTEHVEKEMEEKLEEKSKESQHRTDSKSDKVRTKKKKVTKVKNKISSLNPDLIVKDKNSGGNSQKVVTVGKQKKIKKNKTKDIDLNLGFLRPDLVVDDKNSKENSERATIMDTFEDSEIVHNFAKEKQKELNKDKPKDIDLNLPCLSSSGVWDIDDIFNCAERKMEEKLKKKSKESKNVTRTDSNKVKSKKAKATKAKSKKIDLSIPSQSKKQIIDEEMMEKRFGEEETNPALNDNVEKLKNILNDGVGAKKVSTNKSAQSQDICPEKFVKPTRLDSWHPDLVVEDENSEENRQRAIMMDTFEDSEIVHDFAKEKQEELDKDKPKDIDLNLPGWGSWAGTGIDPKKQRKRRRFIVKMPEAMPRKDDNKGMLIINEKAATKIKPHLVSEVPFPFKTVKDYEASIRSPIGNTFVPELAFRKFIRPAVETKMGTIIEPATTNILMGKPKR